MVLGIVALTTLEKQNKPNYYKPQGNQYHNR